jgi:hypothetical protein
MRLRRFARPTVLFAIALATLLAAASSCGRKGSPAGTKTKTPVIYRYTPLPEPPTPTLRPGQPTHPPEPAC